MGGSGGGGRTFGSGGSGGGDSCTELEFDAVIASPKEDLLKGAVVGERLKVTLETRDARRFAAVVRKGKVAGAIDSHLDQLLPCLREGNEYEAEITKIAGGRFDVHVKYAG